MHIRSVAFLIIPKHFNNQEMRINTVEKYPLDLFYIPDHFKTQKIQGKTVCEVTYCLQYVPSWLVTQDEVKIWHNNNYCNNDEIVEW